jgi:hypothetical protein
MSFRPGQIEGAEKLTKLDQAREEERVAMRGSVASVLRVMIMGEGDRVGPTTAHQLHVLRAGRKVLILTQPPKPEIAAKAQGHVEVDVALYRGDPVRGEIAVLDGLFPQLPPAPLQRWGVAFDPLEEIP